MITAHSGSSETFSSRRVWDELRRDLSDEPDNPQDDASWDIAFNKALIDIRRRLAKHNRTLEGEGFYYLYPVCVM